MRYRHNHYFFNSCRSQYSVCLTNRTFCDDHIIEHVGLTDNTMCIYLWYMKTQINLKIDSNIKKNAQKRAKELGLSLSSVVNATLGQFARTGELELSVAPKMTPYLEELVKEARKEYKLGKTSGPFDSSKDLMKHLNS